MHDLMCNVCSFFLIKCENPEFVNTLENMVFSMYNIWSLVYKLTSFSSINVT